MNSKNDNSTDELKSALRKHGAREFEIVALTMIPERGIAALELALEKGAEHPISYAIKLFDSPDWNPSGEVRRRATNLSAPVSACPTCDGDRFVVVRTRPVTQTPWMKERGIVPPKGAAEDEYAPCPDCNAAADTHFRRVDGSMFRTPDPARTRELMER